MPKESKDAEPIILEGGAMLSTAAELYGAEIDTQISTAKAYPRNVTAFQTRTHSMVTQSTEIAESCEYSMPRDGKQITGPSARFAEVLLFNFGNARAAARIVTIDKKHVTAQGVFHDLESNSATSVEVKRRITKKDGSTYGDDMIQTTAQAACSIAKRNAIIAGIPRALWEDAFNAAKKVAEGTREELPARVEKMFGMFDELGVAPQRVLKFCGYKTADEFTTKKLATLRGIFNAIKDGDLTTDQVFRSDVAAKPSTLDTMAQSTTLGGKSPQTEPVIEKPETDGAEAKTTATAEDQAGDRYRLNRLLSMQETSDGLIREWAYMQDSKLFTDLPGDLRRQIMLHYNECAANLEKAATKAPETPQDGPTLHNAPEVDQTDASDGGELPEPYSEDERKPVVEKLLASIDSAMTKKRLDAIAAQVNNDERLSDADLNDLVDKIAIVRDERNLN